MSQNTAAQKTRTLLLRQTTMVRMLWVAVGLMGLTLASCSSHLPKQETHQERLIGRIDQYYNALQARAYSKTQLFYADRRPRAPADNSSLASKLSLTMASYEIQSLKINAANAQAVMHITVVGHENNYDIVMIDNWQFIQGNWYVVDSSKPATDKSINALDQKVWRNSIEW